MTSYRLVCLNKTHSPQYQRTWYAEKRVNNQVVDTTNDFGTKFRAMYEASKRWPELQTAQELVRMFP